jgi:hypothetical protein
LYRKVKYTVLVYIMLAVMIDRQESKSKAQPVSALTLMERMQSEDPYEQLQAATEVLIMEMARLRQTPLASVGQVVDTSLDTSTPGWTSTMKSPRRTSLRLEFLEAREVPAVINVIPTTQPEDASNKHTLTAAVTAAANNDTIVIRAGTTPDATAVFIGKPLIVTGDPAFLNIALAKYSINVSTTTVTMSNMNLGDVVVNGGKATITNSQISRFFELMTANLSGGNILQLNTITSGVFLNGNNDGTTVTNDLIDRNIFRTNEPFAIRLQDTNGVTVTNNTITSGANGNKIGIGIIGSSANVVVSNNTIMTSGDYGIYIDNSASNATNFVLSARISNNIVNAGSTAFGLSTVRGVNGTLNVLVDGNDFTNNLVGVAINKLSAAAPDNGNIDLGGGTTTLGSSTGGNNFRNYGGTRFAIVTQANTTGTIQAQFNNFSQGVTPASVINDGADNNTTALVNSANALSANRSAVQTYYTKLLGRTGSIAELDAWVNTLPTQGLSGVVNGILYSAESLGRTVQGYYAKYLKRSAAGAEVSSWITSIRSGLSLEEVQARLVGSVEFANNSPNDFIQTAYVLLMGRTATASEVNAWNSQLPTLGRFGVAFNILRSAESFGSRITGLYQTFLHRNPVVAEINAWFSSPFHTIQVQERLLASSEFYTNG